MTINKNIYKHIKNIYFLFKYICNNELIKYIFNIN